MAPPSGTVRAFSSTAPCVSGPDRKTNRLVAGFLPVPAIYASLWAGESKLSAARFTDILHGSYHPNGCNLPLHRIIRPALLRRRFDRIPKIAENVNRNYKIKSGFFTIFRVRNHAGCTKGDRRLAPQRICRRDGNRVRGHRPGKTSRGSRAAPSKVHNSALCSS